MKQQEQIGLNENNSIEEVVKSLDLEFKLCGVFLYHFVDGLHPEEPTYRCKQIVDAAKKHSYSPDELAEFLKQELSIIERSHPDWNESIIIPFLVQKLSTKM